MSQLASSQVDDTLDAKSRLLAAAVESFAAKGFHGTTTRDIATAANMSPAALYVHHKSKEELLYLICRDTHEATLRLLDEAVDDAAPVADQLVALVRAFVIHYARDHTNARIVNYEMMALQPDHRNEIRELRRTLRRRVTDLVAAGVGSGAFDVANPDMTAVALLSLGVDLSRWYRESLTWSPEQIADHYCELALRMVGAAC